MDLNIVKLNNNIDVLAKQLRELLVDYKHRNIDSGVKQEIVVHLKTMLDNVESAQDLEHHLVQAIDKINNPNN